MQLGIYYHKRLAKTGKPLIVSNGKSEIATDRVVLQNVSGVIKFNNAKGSFGKARRHGVTTVLMIGIDDNPDETAQYFKSVTQNKKRALKERERYRRLHPKTKGKRKEIYE
ncbi:MAG: hypothetical protein HZC29_05165 [Thaumarchaeota archaeon]|nr:hypothetical protein [Nitrososphaerota archaeon]